MRGAVDAFEPAGAVERVETAARPVRAGAKPAVPLLLVAVMVEAQHSQEPDAGAVSAGAILHRPPQFAAALDEGAGRPRAGLIDENGIAGMWDPRPVQFGR